MPRITRIKRSRTHPGYENDAPPRKTSGKEEILIILVPLITLQIILNFIEFMHIIGWIILARCYAQVLNRFLKHQLTVDQWALAINQVIAIRHHQLINSHGQVRHRKTLES